MKNNIDLLLARYFGGSATTKDMELLEKWLSSSPENQITFDELTSLYAKLGTGSDVAEPKHKKAAKNILLAHMAMNNDNVTQKKGFVRFSMNRQWMFRAASVLFIVTFFAVGWNMFFAEKQLLMASNIEPIQTTLLDSTIISLDPNSTIKYSSRHGKKSRVIHLEGKATFKAGHKGKGILQICTDELIIEDIGTIFEVSAYKDSNFVSVKVTEGAVHFYTKQNNGLMLHANQTGYFNKKTKVFELQEPQLEKLKSGAIRINFKGMELNKVCKIISDAYGVSIVSSNSEISARKITVNFEGENLDMILDVIAETLNLKVDKMSKSYHISDKSLN